MNESTGGITLESAVLAHRDRWLAGVFLGRMVTEGAFAEDSEGRQGAQLWLQELFGLEPDIPESLPANARIGVNIARFYWDQLVETINRIERRRGSFEELAKIFHSTRDENGLLLSEASEILDLEISGLERRISLGGW